MENTTDTTNEGEFGRTWVNYYMISTQFIYIFFFSFFLYHFVKNRNVEPIKSRFPMWSIFSSVCGFIMILLFTIFNLTDYNETTCWTFWVPVVLLQPLIFVPHFIRAFCLNFQLKWNEEKRQEVRGWYSNHVFLIYRKRYQIVVFFSFLIIEVTAMLATELVTAKGIFPYPMCHELPSAHIFYPLLSFFLLSFIIYGVFIFLLRNTYDTFFIKKELAITLAVSIPAYIVYTVRIHPDTDPKFPHWVHPSWFPQLIIFIVFAVTICYPSYLSYKEDKKLKISRSNSMAMYQSTKLLRIIFEIPNALDVFTDFCERSFCIENLMFLKAVKNLERVEKQKVDPLSSFSKEKEIKILIREILSNYIGEDSPYQINIDATISQSILSIKLDLDRNLTYRIFDEAYLAVFSQLENDTFHRWQKSPGFRKVLASNLSEIERKVGEARNIYQSLSKMPVIMNVV